MGFKQIPNLAMVAVFPGSGHGFHLNLGQIVRAIGHGAPRSCYKLVVRFIQTIPKSPEAVQAL
jgi:ATP:corrinoid adenosyltransferase